MDGVKRHIPPITPFMENADAINLLLLYIGGREVEIFLESPQ